MVMCVTSVSWLAYECCYSLPGLAVFLTWLSNMSDGDESDKEVNTKDGLDKFLAKVDEVGEFCWCVLK